VLKLCNRARGAGVLMVKSSDLPKVLRQILEPPKNLDVLLSEGAWRMTTVDASLLSFDATEEQWRHWWGNEAPSFVAEQLCTSMTVRHEGKAFDGTMRVSFVLRQRYTGDAQPSEGFFEPGDLEVEWLGGYWKLPCAARTAVGTLRERYVSAASASGTLPVADELLREVYTELGDSMQHLFGGPMPAHEWLLEKYADQPEFAAFLIARLGMSSTKDLAKAAVELKAARGALTRATEVDTRRCVRSFFARCDGILVLKSAGGRSANQETWRAASEHFALAARIMPRNANALFWKGFAELNVGSLEDAVTFMNQALLLDPDLKGAYINLGIAYLRQRRYERTVQISNFGLHRFPKTPQCHYHLGVAAYQQAVLLFEDVADEGRDPLLIEIAVDVAATNLQLARDSGDAPAFLPSKTGRVESPWLDEDRRMLDEATALAGTPSPAPLAVHLPPVVGWIFMHWRI